MMFSQPKLIIISGPPGVGKTTLGETLARKLQLPFFSKDSIKEILFDTLGWNNREHASPLQAPSYKMLYYIAKQLLKAKQSVIVESNFLAEFDDKQFNEYRQLFDLNIIQIYCLADKEVLYERFSSRWKDGNRHSGHADDIFFKDFKGLIIKKNYRLSIADKTIDVDMNSFSNLKIDVIVKAIEAN